jgi:hypothetical protein
VLKVLCLAACAVVGAGVAGLSCRAQDEGSPPLPPTSGDANFEPAPPRTVVNDYPPGLSIDLPATQPPDARDRRDAKAPPEPEPLDAGTGRCSLLAQDCQDPLQACYPGANGAGVCRHAGGIPQDTQCLDHVECRKGLLCVDVFGFGLGRTCQRICDPTSTMSCTPGPPCQAFPGSSIGFCPP